MEAREKIEFIEEVLQEFGVSGTAYRVSQMLGVSPSTVQRWYDTKSTPRPKQQAATGRQHSCRAGEIDQRHFQFLLAGQGIELDDRFNRTLTGVP